MCCSLSFGNPSACFVGIGQVFAHFGPEHVRRPNCSMISAELGQTYSGQQSAFHRKHAQETAFGHRGLELWTSLRGSRVPCSNSEPSMCLRCLSSSWQCSPCAWGLKPLSAWQAPAENPTRRDVQPGVRKETCVDSAKIRGFAANGKDKPQICRHLTGSEAMAMRR